MAKVASFDFLGSLVDQVQAAVRLPESPPAGCGEWMAGEYPGGSPVILDRGPFTWERHEYLREPYQDEHPRRVDKKATQLGNSTMAVARVFYCARYPQLRPGTDQRVPFVGILYLFPSRTGVGDFSRSRIAPLIEGNPDLLGRYMKDTDSVGLRRFNGVNLIFRGTRSEEGLRSDPADMVVYDEYDLMPEGIETAARGRMNHSDFKYEHYLSNPTIPDAGIDKKFAATDQRHWMLICPKCGHRTCMEDHFKPGNVKDQSVIVEWNGEVVRLCQHCRNAALDPAVGEWVAKYPSRTDWRGYRFSNLWSQFLTPASILEGLRGLTTRTRQRWWNYVIGDAYIEADARLSVQQVLGLCRDHQIQRSGRGPAWGGVDQGAINLHVVIGASYPDRILFIGILNDWDDVPQLCADLGLSTGVFDAMPEIRAAKKAATCPGLNGKVFLNFYNEHAKVSIWDEKKGQVTTARTESLDESHEALLKGLVELPKDCEMVRLFAEQCHNIASTYEEDEDGNRRKVWKVLGADHFRHAFNYAWMARNRMLGSGFGDCDLS